MLLGFMLGCERADVPVGAEQQDDGSEVVFATVDGKPIPASTVDAPLRLHLHDLDLAKFRAREERLHLLIENRLGSNVRPASATWNERVEINLTAPPPPRLEIPDGRGPARGPASAPVAIVEFFDFESSHSRSIQPALVRILERYPERVRLLVRDLPLPYHRYARQAAVAAHCAGEQRAYWSYRDMLLLELGRLAPSDLALHASRLGLDTEALESCIDSGRHSGRIDEDIDLASRLGVRRAATLFVNGLYLSGVPSHEEIERVVREELVRLGHDPDARGAADQGSSDAISAEREATRAARRAALPEIPPGKIAEPEAIIRLTRAEVDHALRDRNDLDRKLEASRAEFSGQRLLTIGEVSDHDFHARLGLEEGDVLMIVNGEFVTLEHNWIWDAFETEGKVTLLFMRRGLPQVYEYQIR
jgi:protein-disulfide isomerase